MTNIDVLNNLYKIISSYEDTNYCFYLRDHNNLYMFQITPSGEKKSSELTSLFIKVPHTMFLLSKEDIKYLKVELEKILDLVNHCFISVDLINYGFRVKIYDKLSSCIYNKKLRIKSKFSFLPAVIHTLRFNKYK